MVAPYHHWRLTKEKIGARLKLIAPLVHRRFQLLPPFKLVALPSARVDAAMCHDPEQVEIIAHDSYWGRADLNFVMRSHITVPRGWDAHNLALYLPLGVLGDIFNHPEALVHIDHVPVASADRYHNTIPLNADIADGADHNVSLHGWTGLAGWPPDPDHKAKLFMGKPRLVEQCPTTVAFLRKANAAFDTVGVLGIETPEGAGLLDALNEAFQVLDTRDPMGEAFYASVPEALGRLEAGISQAGAPLETVLHGIGHAHMDIAYLWTIDQIRLKNARTYSNVLRLMARDPEFRFSHSQPALYEMMAQDYPDMFARLKDRVAEGRWEVMGGMWVEPDLNIPGGEALVRQLILGRDYFKREFGDVETPVLWLPDTFGFPGQIPQLMRLAGLEWFVTNKLNWNQINRVPWSSHIWEGIDGSRVLAHILTTPRDVQYLPFPTNYKSDLSATEVLGTLTHATGALRDNLPICFGYGDGGGGPTDDLLAKAHAYAAMPGMPRLKMSTVRAAMTALAASWDKMPIWQGEHYMEGHRGVFTSQAWIKRANRKAEAALHEAEALAVMAGTVPKLTDAWKLLCLNQFHDIVTGTSIGAVYENAKQDFYTIFGAADAAARVAAQHLAGSEPLVLSTLPTCGDRIVETDIPSDAPGQPTKNGAVYLLRDVPSYAHVPLSTACLPEHPASARIKDGIAVLENDLLCVEVQKTGALSRLFDKTTGRDILADGALGNQLQVFEDRPICWDAWDIDPYIEDRQEVIATSSTINVVETGPVRASVRVVHHWRNSVITQTLCLYTGSRRLDFVTDVDWHETHMLLKVAFPVAITAPKAVFDIQWGTIERATSRDTAFDAARFEVPAQKWAQISDETGAVALLNDCKYGYDVHRNTLRLTLIKSATSPDPQADQGRHAFTYALLAYDGQDRSLLDHAAYDLNAPARVVAPRKAPASSNRDAFVRCLTPGILIETLVPSNKLNTYDLRLFESRGQTQKAELVFRDEPADVRRTDLFGVELSKQPQVSGKRVLLEVGRFEIVTLRITR
ncbi:alpha-mannosidase [Marivita sp. S0852]|uniref:alpha-mannosidase n=1 Tax=Marivita sp. S0852 TaxID=3373893 RepID=UPI0039821906